MCTIGFLTTIGALIEKPQPQEEHNHKNEDGAKSREVLLIMWLVAGFCIATLYKSTLSAKLSSTEYLTPIDTVEDVLDSGMKLYFSGGPYYIERMQNHPRASIRKLAKFHLQLYDLDITGVPKYVQDK